jgi:hypothetical protein
MRWHLTIAIFLSLAGCNKSSQSEPAAQRSDVEAFRDEICACNDQACIDLVDAKFKSWVKAHKGMEQTAQDREVLKQYVDCARSGGHHGAPDKAQVPSVAP